MNLLEILWISIGLSFDVFAVMVCKGAMLPKIHVKDAICACAIFCVWQQLALLAGNLFAAIPLFSLAYGNISRIWNVVSVLIFAALGCYMLWKAHRRETFFEHREEHLGLKSICILACITSLDAFFAGIGFALLKTELFVEAAAIVIVTILVVIIGLYTGYRLGYEQKKKAYSVGGVLLITAGIDVVIRYLVV